MNYRKQSWIFFLCLSFPLLSIHGESFKLTRDAEFGDLDGNNPLELTIRNFPAEKMEIRPGHWQYKGKAPNKIQKHFKPNTMKVTGGCVDKDGDDMYGWDVQYCYLDGTNAVIKAEYKMESNEIASGTGPAVSFAMRINKIPKGTTVEVTTKEGSMKTFILEKQEIEFEPTTLIRKAIIKVPGQVLKIEPGKDSEMRVRDQRLEDKAAMLSFSCFSKDAKELLSKGSVQKFEMKIQTGPTVK